MNCELPDTGGEPADNRLLLVAGAVADLRGTAQIAAGDRLGHLAVDQIDRAVHRIAAIANGSRTALDLNRIQQQRIGGDRMVRRDGGRIEDRGAVRQDFDARNRLPANHGARRPAAEIVEVYAWKTRQRFPEATLATMGEFGSGKHLNRQRDILSCIERLPRDDDVAGCAPVVAVALLPLFTLNCSILCPRR